MNKRALILGIAGQDGSYLTELLLEKGYEVFGLVRRSSTFNLERIKHLLGGKLPEDNLIYGDMNDFGSVISALKKSQPDEVYNLASHSIVASMANPHLTAQCTALGSIALYEAVRIRLERPSWGQGAK